VKGENEMAMELISKYIGKPDEKFFGYERDESLKDLIHILLDKHRAQLKVSGVVSVVKWNLAWCLSRSTLQPADKFAAVIYDGSKNGYLTLQEIEEEGEKTLGIGLTDKGWKYIDRPGAES